MEKPREISTLRDLVGLWPKLADLADDMGLKKTSHLHTMLTRGSIHTDYWPAIISSAERRQIPDVTADLLLKLHTVAAEPA